MSQTFIISAYRLILMSLCLAAIYYLAIKSFFLEGDTVDYKYIWLAGYMWDMQLNPYSSAFTELGAEMFKGLHQPQTLFYPPSWWPIATPLATLTYESSYALWRNINGGFVVLGVITILWAYHKAIRPITLPICASVVVFACFTSATPTTLAMGQTSILLFLACASFMGAYIYRNTPLMIIALFLMTLKPTVGIVFWVFLFMQKDWWRSIAIATVLVFLSSLPSLIIAGPLNLVSDYLAGLKVHADLLPNIPPSMTGLRNLGHYFFAFTISVPLLTVIAIILAALTGLFVQFRSSQTAHARLLAFGLVTLMFSVFVPLHTYDGTYFAVIALIAWALPMKSRIVMFLGLACILRYNNLALAIDFVDPEAGFFPGSRLVSLATLVMLTTFLVTLWQGKLLNGAQDERPQTAG